jgi:AcrR family transcriptional regulator
MPDTGKGVDPRIRRTKLLFREALFELLKSRKFPEINIKDIANTAGVSRQAFYAHFKDKEELLLSSIDEIFTRLDSDLQSEVFREYSSREQLQYLFTCLFRHWQKNSSKLRFVFQMKNVAIVIFRIRKNIGNIVEKSCGISDPARSGYDKLPYILDLTSGSIYMILKRWVEDGMKISVSEMGEFTAQMFDGYKVLQNYNNHE